MLGHSAVIYLIILSHKTLKNIVKTDETEGSYYSAAERADIKTMTH